MTATRAVMRRINIENIVNLSEKLPVHLVDRLYLSVAATGNKYDIFGRILKRSESELDNTVWMTYSVKEDSAGLDM